MRLAYYPGCSAKGSSADYEMSTQAVCGALGMRLEELPDWNCCDEANKQTIVIKAKT